MTSAMQAITTVEPDTTPAATIEPDTLRAAPIATYNATARFNASTLTFNGGTVGRPFLSKEVNSTHG